MRDSSRSPPHRARSDLRPWPPLCRTRPGRPESGCAPSPVPKTPRAPAPPFRAACTRTRTCMAPPGRAAGRTRAAAGPPARRRAGARRAARARSGWFGSCRDIYLWRDPHGSRWMSIRLLALIPVAAAISLALSAAVDAVALPLFLDTTGTILAAALAGPGVGIATGVVTSAVNTLRNPTFWPFVVVQIIVALYAWVAARAGLFRSFRTAVPAGLGLGVIASLTSTPISYFVFGCTTTGGIALTTALGRALGLPPLAACFFGSFVSDFGDKAVTFALVTSVLHALPRRTAAPFWVFLLVLHDVATTVAIGLRITTMVASFVWLVAALEPARLVEAMVAAGWSASVAYVFGATLSAVPVLKARARRIVEAQRARGLSARGGIAARLRALRALALPLVLSALHEVDERALALETRGLVPGIRRTPLAPPPDTPAERAARWALLLVCLFALFRRVL